MTQPENRERPCPAPLPPELETAGEEDWKRFIEACRKAGLEASDDPAVRQTAARAMALSEYVTRSARRNPETLFDLIATEDLFRPYTGEDWQKKTARALDGATGADAMAPRLRRLRRREMVRIIARDLAGLADLASTMADLTAFAEACLDQCLDALYSELAAKWGTPQNKEGAPQHLVVIGMGKLGAGELNLSSDIDLIFAYEENGETHGAEKSIPNEDFFARLCRALIQVIGANTAEGFVFRVDARLRPFGENGPLAMCFDAMEDYYQHQGREWERYAWIKARVVAGDPAAGNALMERMRPFVYRRYLDYGAIEALRDMKNKIAMEIRRQPLRDNVKLGRGGIREIEFFGQVFQLMRGGVLPALRQRGILAVLDTLSAENDIDDATRRELAAAYGFLRDTEHRIQGYADQQTHDLPTDARRRLCLAAAMGFSGWEAFHAALDGHRQRVHAHFAGLLEAGTDARPPDTPNDEDMLAEIWQNGAATPGGHDLLVRKGFADPGAVFSALADLRTGGATRALSLNGRRRLDRLIPRVLDAAGSAEDPDAAMTRVLDLIRTVQQRTNYLALLLENRSALNHLIRFADISPWIVAFLSRHPVLLDELLDPRTLFAPPGRAELETEIQRRLARIDAEDLEYQIESLCIFRQINTLRVAAADITGALTLMRTSDHLTEIAETVLATVLELAWNHLVGKHGPPRCALGSTPCTQGFAVIAYGKMGGFELGYGSDLDLVFLHAGLPGDTQGDRLPVDNAQFFSRLGQRVIHILTAHTRAGKLYDTDMRLRPSGSGGILVSHVDAFAAYQADEAWTWEHQALVRARAVAGDPALMARFTDIRHRVLASQRNSETLAREVADMRQKMRKVKFQPDLFDIKQGNGGMVDIEFIVQRLILEHSHRHPELTRWSDNVRQIESLMGTGILDEGQARLMRSAYLTYRAEVHRRNLQKRPAHVPMDRFGNTPEKISALWKHLF